MYDSHELLPELISRLPELEWKVNGLDPTLFGHSLPRGLFRSRQELTGTVCVNEIKADIQSLSAQENERGAYFLAQRIKQKINTLVTLCQMDGRKKKEQGKVFFGVKMLSTRQQWLQSLEHDIDSLLLQQQALLRAWEQMKQDANTPAVLNLKGELGEIERRLTLAQEALNQATS